MSGKRVGRMALLALAASGWMRAAEPVRLLATPLSDAGGVFQQLNTPLTSGAPATFSIPQVNTPTLYAGDFGFRIAVPAEATQLEVRLGSIPSSLQFAIFLRYGQDFTTGTSQANHGGIVNQNPLVVTRSSSPALRAGTYYIAIAIISSPAPVVGSITATVTTPSTPPPPSPGGGGSGLMQNGTPSSITITAITSPTVFRGLRIDVPAGASRLEVRVSLPASVQFAIALRWGQEIVPSPLTSDYPVTVGNNPLVITTSSSPPLRAGTYYIGVVVVSNSSTANGTVTATHSTTAPPPPAAAAFAVSATSLNFSASPGTNPSSQTFAVRNSGGGTLNFLIASSQPWLSASPDRGSSTGQNVTITVAVSTAGLSTGTYNGELRISQGTVAASLPGASQVGPVTVAVRLEVRGPQPQIPSGSAVNAASSAPNAAPEIILSLYGSNLAASTAVAERTPLPTSLAGTSVRVRDSAGTERLAPLFFVSPGQINLGIPEGTARGTATMTVARADGGSGSTTVQIDPVAPGLFSANATGRGVAAALAIRAGADGAQALVPVFQCGAAAGSCTPAAIDLGPESDQVILLLFGTGIRGRSTLGAVRATVGGENAEVLFAGPQGAFVGLDQANVRIPRSLIGRGDVDVVLTVDGRTSNAVTIRVGGSVPAPVISNGSFQVRRDASGFTVIGRFDFTDRDGDILYTGALAGSAKTRFSVHLGGFPNGVLCRTDVSGTALDKAGQTSGNVSFTFTLTGGSRADGNFLVAVQLIDAAGNVSNHIDFEPGTWQCGGS